MPGSGRLYDLCICGKGSIGIYVTASGDTFTNNRGELRIFDVYV